MSQEIENEAIQLFFSRENVGNSLVIMCNNSKLTGDVITQVATAMMKTPIQIQLTLIGLQPFTGKELMVPYEHMNVSQKEFISRSIKDDKLWTVYDSSMTLRSPNKNVLIDPLDVLEGLCQKVLSTTAYDNEKLRLVLCNIILQRVKSSVPLSCALQNGLNQRLFKGDGTGIQTDGGNSSGRMNEVGDVDDAPRRI